MGKWAETEEAYFGRTDSKEDKETMKNRVLPILFNTEMVQAILDGRKTVTRRALKPPFEVHPNGFITKPRGNERLCPYEPPYQPGDILYVRETWCKNADSKEYYYAANRKAGACAPYGLKWHPSIHMPKEAARIWLKVTDVRVERLQDIDDASAKAEGANWKNGKHVGFEEKLQRSAIERFAEIWDSTIKKDDLESYGWDANPWVWVIEFERCAEQEEL